MAVKINELQDINGSEN